MKKHLLLLFFLTVVATGIDQGITTFMQNEIANPQGASPLIWLFGLMQIISSLLFPLLTGLLILSLFNKESSPTVYWQKFFSQSLKEVMRAWGQSMLWSFLFIIPGIIKFVRFFFVPLIVCFDPQYQSGQVDALKRSQEISKGRLILLLLILLAFDAFLPLVMSSFDQWSVLWRTPVSALALCFVEMLFNICFIWSLWRIYESTFSMERR